MQQYTLTLVLLLLVLGMTGCDIASDPNYVSWDEIKAKPKVPFLERDDSRDAQRMSEGFVKKFSKLLVQQNFLELVLNIRKKVWK